MKAWAALEPNQLPKDQIPNFFEKLGILSFFAPSTIRRGTEMKSILVVDGDRLSRRFLTIILL